MERRATGHQELNPLWAWPAPALIQEMSQTALRFEREKLYMQKQQAAAHGEFELAGMDGRPRAAGRALTEKKYLGSVALEHAAVQGKQ
jgi:hypothetical protein